MRNSLAARSAEVNAAYNASLQNLGEEPKKFVIATDIGGTGMRAVLLEVNPDRTLNSSPFHVVEINFKGLIPFADAYMDCVMPCFASANKNGGFVAGISLGSPGKFITPEAYQVYGAPKFGGLIAAALGNPGRKDLADNGTNCLIANNTANHLCLKESPDEFNGVNMKRLLSDIGPEGVPLEVHNDAALQAIALANKYFAGSGIKTIFYDGPGSGLGTAVLVLVDGRYVAVTDGHLQRIKLGRRIEDAHELQTTSDLVFEFCRKDGREVYEHLEEGFVQPDDLLSGKGLMRLIADVFKSYGLVVVEEEEEKAAYAAKANVQLVLSRKEFEMQVDGILKGEPNQLSAIVTGKQLPGITFEIKCRIKAVGRYRADFLALIHSGAMEFVDEKATWSQSDVDIMRCFGGVVFGGGITKAPWYRLELEDVMRSLSSIVKTPVEFRIPGDDCEKAMKLATAEIVVPEALNVDFAALRALHEKNPPRSAARRA